MAKLSFLHDFANDIHLRPLLNEDLSLLLVWHNDYEVTKFSMNSLIFPQTEEDTKEFIAQQKSQKIITLGIVYEKNLIGYIGLSSINFINRSAEFFIFLGEKSLWGKGIGFHASRLMINYGFKTLGLHRIELTVSDLNQRAEKLYSKLGFKKEGIKRQASFREGQYHGKIMMSLLEDEWVK